MAQVLDCLEATRQQFSFSAEHRQGEASRHGLQQAGIKLDSGQTRVSPSQHCRHLEWVILQGEVILGTVLY